MDLLSVKTVSKAIKYIQSHCETKLLIKSEVLPLQDCFGRVAFKTIQSDMDVPNFRRSTVDGYAVICKDTLGASETIPSLLKMMESLNMGEVSTHSIISGQCSYVPTGGMLPKGADAVVMIEHTEIYPHQQCLVYRPVSYFENVVDQGSDFTTGYTLVEAGHVIDFPTIGRLAAAGIQYVEVRQRYKAMVISTGDEVVPIGAPLSMAKVYDINQSLIVAALKSLNIDVTVQTHIQDQYEVILSLLKTHINTIDFVFMSGGSSQGEKDYTARLFNELGNPGVWMHGLSIKPGKPTILGASNHTLLIGLPGHPVSAFAVWLRMFRTAYLNTCKVSINTVMVTLPFNVLSSAGKETILFLNIDQTQQPTKVTILYSKSGLISTLFNANAYLVIEENKEGYPAGAQVQAIWI